jgi:hypothetical protein
MGQSHEMTVRWSVRGCVMLAVPYAYPRSSSSSDRHRDGAYAEATKQLKNWSLHSSYDARNHVL